MRRSHQVIARKDVSVVGNERLRISVGPIEGIFSRFGIAIRRAVLQASLVQIHHVGGIIHIPVAYKIFKNDVGNGDLTDRLGIAPRSDPKAERFPLFFVQHERRGCPFRRELLPFASHSRLFVPRQFVAKLHIVVLIRCKCCGIEVGRDP